MTSGKGLHKCRGSRLLRVAAPGPHEVQAYGERTKPFLRTDFREDENGIRVAGKQPVDGSQEARVGIPGEVPPRTGVQCGRTMRRRSIDVQPCLRLTPEGGLDLEEPGNT